MRSPHSLAWECRTDRVHAIIVKNARNAIPLSRGIFFSNLFALFHACPCLAIRKQKKTFHIPRRLEIQNMCHNFRHVEVMFTWCVALRPEVLEFLSPTTRCNAGPPKMFSTNASRMWHFFCVSLFDLRLFAFQWTMDDATEHANSGGLSSIFGILMY